VHAWSLSFFSSSLLCSPCAISSIDDEISRLMRQVADRSARKTREKSQSVLTILISPSLSALREGLLSGRRESRYERALRVSRVPWHKSIANCSCTLPLSGRSRSSTVVCHLSRGVASRLEGGSGRNAYSSPWKPRHVLVKADSGSLLDVWRLCQLLSV